MHVTPARLLVLVAVLCFALAAFGVSPASFNLTDAGPAFGFGSFLV